MDPNTTLAEIRRLINVLESRSHRGVLTDHDARLVAQELINAVDGLDQWLSTGGFLPSDWNPPARSAYER